MSLPEKTITFNIYRLQPGTSQPRLDTYKTPVRRGTTILDALINIRENQDETLTFRYSCRMGICGSCSMIVNGKPMLACYTQVLDVGDDTLTIMPLRNIPTIKDLVADVRPFFDKYKVVKPYLAKSGEAMKTADEFIQKPEELAKYWDYSLCIKCGICYSACPAAIDEAFLGPTAHSTSYRFTVDSRDEGIEDRLRDTAPNIWLCTSCSSCTITCPKKVDSASSIVESKSMIVERANIPRTVRDVLNNTYRYHNPLGMMESKRADWYSDLGVKELSSGQKFDALCFVCCSQAYDPRNQKAAKDLVSILKKASFDFALIGTDEWCCGDHMLRLGEKGLAEELAQHNVSLFETHNVKRIFTTSPHCYNTFKHDKPYSDTHVEIQHYTELIANAIGQGRLKPTKSIEKKVTYHDPCFLGKRNGIYEPPRKILESVPGLRLVEMERTKENSYCCGGGAGRVFIEEAATEKRPCVNRVNEALKTGADILATACPYCIVTLEDAVKVLGVEEKIKVMDISEVLKEAL